MQKLTKKQARGLYNKGIEVLFVPSKMHPKNLWGLSIKACINQAAGETLFDDFLNAFRYYNCSKETGLRVSFYKL